MKMDLDREHIDLLIEEYEKHRVLWDTKHKYYFNKSKKGTAWQEIAATLEIDVEDAKKKISSLLGSFRRERAKGTMRSRKGGGIVYKSSWFAFKNFAFLLDKGSLNETTNSEEAGEHDQEPPKDTSIDQPGGSSPGDGNSEILEVTTDSDSAQENIPTFVKRSTLKKKPKKRVRKSVSEDPRIEMAFHALHEAEEQDDCTMKFAKYLADKLNQFEERTKAILIHRINTLIFETEMSLYPDPPTVYTTAAMTATPTVQPPGSAVALSSTPLPFQTCYVLSSPNAALK